LRRAATLLLLIAARLLWLVHILLRGPARLSGRWAIALRARALGQPAAADPGIAGLDRRVRRHLAHEEDGMRGG
jgi:hypothetical protein